MNKSFVYCILDSREELKELSKLAAQEGSTLLHFETTTQRLSNISGLAVNETTLPIGDVCKVVFHICTTQNKSGIYLGYGEHINRLRQTQSTNDNKVIWASRSKIDLSSLSPSGLDSFLYGFYTPTKIINELPYRYNATNAEFFVEFLLQCYLSNTPIISYPVQSSSSLESLSVFNVSRAKIKKLIHEADQQKKGLSYLDKFDCIKNNEQYSLKINYSSTHQYALDSIESNKNVLDIGAGPYGLANYLLDKGCNVVTLDQYDVVQPHPKVKHKVIDFNCPFSESIDGFNYILIMDVLEHLLDPQRFMDGLSDKFTSNNQKLILSTGNIAFILTRISLLFGNFNYTKSGILDKTHTRLFTFRTFKSLILNSNLEIVKTQGIPAPFPKIFGDNSFSRFLLFINNLLIKVSKSLFSYQIFIIAKTVPSTKHIARSLTTTSGQ